MTGWRWEAIEGRPDVVADRLTELEHADRLVKDIDGHPMMYPSLTEVHERVGGVERGSLWYVVLVLVTEETTH